MANQCNYIEKSNRRLSWYFTLANLSLINVDDFLSKHFEHPVNVHWHTIRIWSFLLEWVTRVRSFIHQERSFFDFLLRHFQRILGFIDVFLKLDSIGVLRNVFLVHCSFKLIFSLDQVFVVLLVFLHLTNHFQVILFFVLKDWFKLIRIFELELVFVIVIWYINQMQRHKLVEPVFPVFLCHTLTNICPCASCAPISSGTYACTEVLPSGRWLFAEEFKSDISVNLFIIFENDVVKGPIVFVLVNPTAFTMLFLGFQLFFSLLQEILVWQLNDEVLIVFEAIELITILLDLTFNCLDLRIELLQLIFPLLLLLLFSPLLLLFFQFKTVIVMDELDQINVVSFKLVLWHFQWFITTILLQFEILDFFLNSIVGQLSQEHFFLLVNEFIDILCSLLPWVLDARSGNVHGHANVTPLLRVEAEQLLLLFSRWNISVSHTS